MRYGCVEETFLKKINAVWRLCMFKCIKVESVRNVGKMKILVPKERIFI